MVNLYFIRHGESTGNASGSVGGQTDWELTTKGIEQAKKAGQHVRQKNVPIDVVISSPLQRAHHTAKEVASAINYDHDQIVLMPEIQERFFGAMEGKPEEDFGVGKQVYWDNPASVDHIEDIETIRDLHDRAELVLEMLKARPEENILIASHTAFGRSLRKAIEGIAHDAPIESFENAKLIKLI